MDEFMTVELTLDNDEVVECAILTLFEAGENQYIALLPLNEEGETEEGDVYLYRYIENADGEPELQNIEDDDEYEIAADAFDEWMEPERICRACTLVVAVRDHASYAELNREIQRLSARYNGNFALLDTMNIDVSSHQIRQWISEEKSLKYYVPDKVISYMKENGIYRKKEV